MATTEEVQSIISSAYDRIQCHGDDSNFDFTPMAINYEFETIGGEGRKIEYNPIGYTAYTPIPVTSYSKSLIADIPDLNDISRIYNPSYRWSRCEGHVTCIGYRNAANIANVPKCLVLCTSQKPEDLPGGFPNDCYVTLPCSDTSIGVAETYMTNCLYGPDGLTFNNVWMKNATFGTPRLNIITPPNTYRGAFSYVRNSQTYCSNSFRTTVLEDPTKKRTLCTVSPGSTQKDVLLYQETESTGVLGFYPSVTGSRDVSSLGGASRLKYFAVQEDSPGLAADGSDDWSWTDYGTSNSYGLVTNWVSPRWLLGVGNTPFTMMQYNEKILKSNEGIISSYYPTDGGGPSVNLGVPLIYAKKAGELTFRLEMEDNTKNYNFWFSDGPMVNKDLTVAANRPTNIIKPKVNKNSYDGITITGSGTVNLDINSECLVYVAWTENGKKGGGTLKLPVEGTLTFTD